VGNIKIGQSRADDIRPKTIKALLNKVEEKGPVMANRVRALLAAIFRYGKDQFIIEANPVKEVKAPGKERRRQRALDTDHSCATASSALSGDKKFRLVSRTARGQSTHLLNTAFVSVIGCMHMD